MATTLVSNREGAISKQSTSIGTVWTRARITVTGEQIGLDKYKITVTGQTRSGDRMGVQSGNHCVVNWGVTGYAGIDRVGSTTSSRHQYNYTNWVCTTTYSANISQSNSAQQIPCYANFSGAENLSCRVSVTVTVPPKPIQVPPNVSEVNVLMDSENSNLVLSWTNNGVAPQAPTINIVDVQMNDGEWVNIYNGSLITTTTYQAIDNNKYKFRVLSGNSAGNSSYIESNIIYTKPEKPKFISGNISSIDNKYILKIKTDFSDTNYPTSLNISFVQTSTGEVVKTSTIDDQKIIEAKINNYELVINKDIQPDDADYSLLQAILAAKRKESSLTLQAKTLIDYQEQNLESDNTTYEILNIKYVPSILFKIPTDKTIPKEQKEDIPIDYQTLADGMPIYFSVPEEQNTFSFYIFNIEGTLNSLEGISFNVRKKSEVTSTYTQQIYNESLQDTSPDKTIKITNLTKGDYLFELSFDEGIATLPGFDFSFKSNLTYTTLVAPSIQSIYARIPDITKPEEKTEVVLKNYTMPAKAERFVVGDFDVLPETELSINFTRSQPTLVTGQDGGEIRIVDKSNEENIIGTIACKPITSMIPDSRTIAYFNDSKEIKTYRILLIATQPYSQFTIDKLTVTRQVLVPYHVKDLLFPIDDSYLTT